MRIGLTGGIGSGKSTAARRFAQLGALVIDADAVAREVVEPGTDGLAAVVAEFGPRVLDGSGRLDRPALAALVFADDVARERLNGILHPRIRARVAERIAAAPPGTVVVQDVPLLVETGQADAYDLVVVVEAPADLRVQRLVRDRGLPAEQARARMAAQASDEQRRAAADVVLVNDGTPDDLRAKVDRLWADHVQPAHRRPHAPPAAGRAGPRGPAADPAN
jgi:dephospho-CoA kinase